MLLIPETYLYRWVKIRSLIDQILLLLFFVVVAVVVVAIVVVVIVLVVDPTKLHLKSG